MIVLEIVREWDGIEIPDDLIRTLALEVCARFSVEHAVLTVVIVDDREICRLNREFMNRQGSTDCFTFDLSEPEAGDAEKTFEIVVNGQKAVSEAEARAHSSRAECALYIVHGLLHAMGLDDATEDQARTMHTLEDEILQCHGLGVVYNTERQNRPTELM